MKTFSDSFKKNLKKRLILAIPFYDKFGEKKTEEFHMENEGIIPFSIKK